MPRRIEWIDQLKGVAILIVVIRHVMQSNIINCSETILGNAIFAVQMPLFMIVSGYFSVTSERYYKFRDELKTYIKKRTMHYMLPFASWFIIVNVFIRGFYERNIIQAMCVLVNNIDVGLWFLYVVFILSLVIIVAKRICYKAKRIQNAGIASIIIGGVMLLPLVFIGKILGMRFMGINLILYYYVFFALGHTLFLYKEKIKLISNNNVRLMCGFGLSLIIFTLIILTHNIELSPDSIINVAIRILAAITGSLVIAIAVYKLSKGKKSLLAKIGQFTLEIYVVHVCYIGVLPKGEYYFYTFDGVIFFLLAFLITMALTTFTIFFITKIPILNIIFFGKKPIQSDHQ